MNQLSYFIFRILKFAIIFYILFLVFTNLGTVLLVLAGIFVALYFLIYSKVKEIKNEVVKKYPDQSCPERYLSDNLRARIVFGGPQPLVCFFWYW